MPSSDDIVEQIRAGSSVAEQELADQYLPRIRTFLRSRTNNPDFVEEITQEAFMAVLKVLREGRFRNESSLGTFVCSVARKQLAEAYRKQARDRSVPMPENLDPAIPQPDAPAEWQQTARREMEALEPVDRNLLWLILVEGFRPDEIASRMSLSADAIRQRKSRVLRRIAEKMGIVSQTGPAARPISRNPGKDADAL